MQNKNALYLIILTILIDSIGFGIVIPIIPDLLKSLNIPNLSESSGIAGWLIFAYAISQFIFSPLLGALSDRFGRKPVLVLSLLGLGLDYIFHFFAGTITLLFIGRVIAGICGASFSTASAYIADVTPPEKRAQNFGLIGVAFGMGFIIGPIIGGLCSGIDYFGPEIAVRIPFLLAACLSIINALLCIFILPESLPKNNRRNPNWARANPIGSIQTVSKYPQIIGLLIPIFILYLASHAVQSNWSFYTIYKFKWTAKEVGLSLTVVGILIAIVQGGLIRIILPKLGLKKSIFIGFALYTVGMLLFGLATASWMMYAVTAIYCLGGISGPAIQQIMSAQVPSNQQGELNGILTSTMSLTTIIGPLIMSNTFKFFTNPLNGYNLPGAPMLLAAILIFVAWMFTIKPLKNLNEKELENQMKKAQTPEILDNEI